MNFWIFQSIAERYDLRDSKIVVPGKRDTWYATRYKNRMEVGDRVFFWLGGIGDQRGVYATGEIASESYQKPEWGSAGIDVIYDKKLESPIVVSTLQNNSVLRNLLILRAPQATNFLLTPDEASELSSIIERGSHA